jgi:hypothetical protein
MQLFQCYQKKKKKRKEKQDIAEEELRISPSAPSKNAGSSLLLALIYSSILVLVLFFSY